MGKTYIIGPGDGCNRSGEEQSPHDDLACRLAREREVLVDVFSLPSGRALLILTMWFHLSIEGSSWGGSV
jgi:hypothetical protein